MLRRALVLDFRLSDVRAVPFVVNELRKSIVLRAVLGNTKLYFDILP